MLDLIGPKQLDVILEAHLDYLVIFDRPILPRHHYRLVALEDEDDAFLSRMLTHSRTSTTTCVRIHTLRTTARLRSAPGCSRLVVEFLASRPRPHAPAYRSRPL